MSDETMITFGPVPSRRLGRSLGINNIPPKICTYSCVYCQLGRTIQMRVGRGSYYEPDVVSTAVRDRVQKARAVGESIDYLTFVPDGEPTLDAELGREIALLKGLRIPVAVISNGSLIGRGDVREDLLRADWVSLKIDAVEDAVWQRVDRPHGSLQLAEMLEGALRFARAFRGRLVTETMLVAGINDSAEHLREVAGYLARLQPAVAYLAVPTRPPAEAWVRPPDAPALNRAFQLFQEKGSPVEYLIGYEGDAFAFTGDAEADLLSITAVHPMRRDAVVAFLARAGSEWGVVEALLADGRLVQTFYGNHEFYVRRLAGPG